MESWPLFSLELRTPRLSLRLGRDEEIDRLARTSAGRVLPAEQGGSIPLTITCLDACRAMFGID